MQFSVSVLALAATVAATYNGTAPSYTTEVVTAYTTYCPAATQLSYNGQTYTVTEVSIIESLATGGPGDGCQRGARRCHLRTRY